ncbi:MAG: 4'-phosphopantetheinyl transferase superfamily protein [Terriglobales bacterium]|jgi:4'-phosphopantetheinyl transferase
MEVYWLEQTEADLPAENAWLSANEIARLNGMRFAKRRDSWRLGRWTAKRALASYLNLPAHPHVLKEIEIRPATSGAPEAFLANKPAVVTVSLSHRDGRAICAVAPSGVELGCDLEVIEPHGDAFLSDYFTAEEQALVARAPAMDRARFLTLLWSGKESALKALRTGLRLDTRSVIVSPDDESFDLNGWSRLQVRYTNGRIFHGWWQHTDNILRTVVANSPPDSPIPLKIPVYLSDRVALCT